MLTKVYARCAPWLLIALLWISLEFGLLFISRGNETRMLACLLGLIGRVLPASCCPDTLVQITLVSSIGLRAYCIFYLARASQLEK